MADGLNSFKILCQGGLNTSRDVLSQGENASGSAISLINYEPAITGGYRRISGYSNEYGTVPGQGPVLGVAVANNVNDGILACRKPLTGYNYLHYWDNATQDWVAVTSAGTPTMVGVSKVRFSRYSFAGDGVILTDGINPAAVFDGTTYTQITHSEAPAAPKFSEVFKNHLFLAGDTSEPYNLYFSAPYSGLDFSPANGAGVINVGFSIVQIKAFRDELYIFGVNNIKKLSGNNLADFSIKQVTNDLGCLASDSVVEIGGDLLFLSQDGLRPVSGTDKIGDVNLETISKDIQSIFTEVVFDIDLEGLSSVLIRQKTQFRLFFKAQESLGLIGGFRLSQGGLSFEYGQLLGIEATCADSGYIGQYEYVIHGDSTGKVHRQEIGNSLNGEPIFSLYQTPYIHMEDPELRKSIYTVSTYMRSEGDNNIVLSVVYDYEDFNTLNPTNYDLVTSGAAAYFNESLYDSTAIFDGNPSPVQRVNVSGSGRSVSVKYVTNSTDASHSIQGIVLTYNVSDRR